jgi:hypothetical protein
MVPADAVFSTNVMKNPFDTLAGKFKGVELDSMPFPVAYLLTVTRLCGMRVPVDCSISLCARIDSGQTLFAQTSNFASSSVTLTPAEAAVGSVSGYARYGYRKSLWVASHPHKFELKLENSECNMIFVCVTGSLAPRSAPAAATTLILISGQLLLRSRYRSFAPVILNSRVHSVFPTIPVELTGAIRSLDSL